MRIWSVSAGTSELLRNSSMDISYNMEKKMRVVACVALALYFAVPFFPRLSFSADRIKLALPAKSMGYLPLYVAVHRGFFKDEGIDIEMPMMLPQFARRALVSGEIV